MRKAESVPKLIRKLRKDSSDSWEAATALAEIGTPAVQPLIEALKDPNYGVRESAAYALGEIKDPSAIAPLIEVLEDEHEHVRYSAQEALVEIGTQAVERLNTCLKDGDSHIRKEVAYILGQIKDIRSAEPLLVALKDTSEDVRKEVIESLGAINDVSPLESAIVPLIKALKDTNEAVRLRSAYILADIGSPAIEPLIEALKDDDRNVRYAAAEAIRFAATDEKHEDKVRTRDLLTVEPLIELLNDTEQDIRQKALLAIKETGYKYENDTRIVEILNEALKKKDLATMADFYDYFIRKGEKGTEGILKKILDKFGSKTMAEDFINCGNEKLARIARTWANKYGYEIQQQIDYGKRSYWGSL